MIPETDDVPARPAARVAARVRPAATYLAVGGASFVIDTGLLVGLHELVGAPLALATAVGFFAGLSFNFAANRRMVFPGGVSPTSRQLVRYGVLVAANLLVTLGVVTGLAAVGVAYPLAKVVATGTLFGVNYVLYRHWVFT